MTNKLKELTDMIVKDGKMSSEEVITKLTDAIENDVCDVYCQMYESAYGKQLNKTLAEKLVRKMPVTDSSERSDGQKWSYEQTTDVGNKIGINWAEVPKCEWYFVMNMYYSDTYDTAKYAEKQNDAMYFAHLAKDWCYDEDAPADKTYRYVMKVLA